MVQSNGSIEPCDRMVQSNGPIECSMQIEDAELRAVSREAEHKEALRTLREDEVGIRLLTSTYYNQSHFSNHGTSVFFSCRMIARGRAQGCAQDAARRRSGRWHALTRSQGDIFVIHNILVIVTCRVLIPPWVRSDVVPRQDYGRQGIHEHQGDEGPRCRAAKQPMLVGLPRGPRPPVNILVIITARSLAARQPAMLLYPQSILSGTH